MNTTVATVVIVIALLLALASLITAIRNRAMGTILLAGFCVLEVAVLVQVGFTIAAVAGGEGAHVSKGTLFGYLAGQVIIPPAGVFLALAERSRWGTGILVVAGFAIAVMTARLLQIWQGQ
ncbi:hypothetical protein OIE66_08140 [Nonomuraea sp. NBC_01738]|uniref:hypothetical protein n=1 Tax=Nonomuraea sp. NBC_01738 TaxID=2976003 RepID=UPI002E0D39E4|nr:hypothetical protein OIE66_08140 [Nonomuraea sp. NBC_01738]